MFNNRMAEGSRFHCRMCGYGTDKVSNWRKHLRTEKHIAHSCAARRTYECERCGKKYKHQPSLSRHYLECPKAGVSEANPSPVSAPQPSVVINNTTINVALVLSTRYPDALNMSEFTARLRPTLEAIRHTGNVGYVEGLSDVFVKGLEAVGVERRPIHSSNDGKGLYVKEDEVWGCNDATALIQNIHTVAKSQLDAIGSLDTSGLAEEEYVSIVRSVAGGTTSGAQAKNDKAVCKAIASKCALEDELKA